jgi:xylulokinase
LSSGYLLGYDVGSSFVKAALLDAETGALVASASAPEQEMEIVSPKPGWAEQHPSVWWDNVKKATALLKAASNVDLREVCAIGISYQMHGLVLVDQNMQVLRPAIIWCDSRAVDIGERAFNSLGEHTCLQRLLNSPGNFTASKLKWVMDREPEIYKRVYKMMLPGDYIAMMMTGDIFTSTSGLSEMILWDYADDKIADFLLRHFGISPDLIPNVVPNFFDQGILTEKAAAELGLKPRTLVSYRAGDQPNNAFSLNVLRAGEIAATAGTSGVVFGVTDKPVSDEQSRVNTFVHVNHANANPRYGVLLCINGTGILNTWLKKNIVTFGQDTLTYNQMNKLAEIIPAGSEGVVILSYGNGAERSLNNRNIGAVIANLDLNIHSKAHILRAAQEGIVFALKHGMEIMTGMGIDIHSVKAGNANMFLSPIFCETFATVANAPITLYNTDGAQGAARGAGVGAGIYESAEDAFTGLATVKVIEPNLKKRETYLEAYMRWTEVLKKYLTEGGTYDID